MNKMTNTLTTQINELEQTIETGTEKLKGTIKYNKQKHLEQILDETKRIRYNHNLKLSLKNSSNLQEKIYTYIENLPDLRNELYDLIKTTNIPEQTIETYFKSLENLKKEPKYIEETVGNVLKRYFLGISAPLKACGFLGETGGLIAGISLILDALTILTLTTDHGIAKNGFGNEYDFPEKLIGPLNKIKYQKRLKKRMKELNTFSEETEHLLNQYAQTEEIADSQTINLITDTYKKTQNLITEINKYAHFPATE